MPESKLRADPSVVAKPARQFAGPFLVGGRPDPYVIAHGPVALFVDQRHGAARTIAVRVLVDHVTKAAYSAGSVFVLRVRGVTALLYFSVAHHVGLACENEYLHRAVWHVGTISPQNGRQNQHGNDKNSTGQRTIHSRSFRQTLVVSYPEPTEQFANMASRPDGRAGGTSFGLEMRPPRP